MPSGKICCATCCDYMPQTTANPAKGEHAFLTPLGLGGWKCEGCGYRIEKMQRDGD